MSSLIVLCIKLLVFISLLYLTSSTINPRPKYNKEIEEFTITPFGPLPQNVFDRQLVQKEPLSEDITTHNGGYCKNTTIRKFRGKIMSYVSIWHNNGYDASIIWAGKFDMLTPDWFRIHRIGENLYEYLEHHGADKNWVDHIRHISKTNQKTVEIFPRFVLDEFARDDLTELFSKHSERKALYKLILKMCREFNFNGIVLEIWLDLHQKIHLSHLSNFILALAMDLKAEGYKIILVVPPYNETDANAFTAKYFEYFYSHVDFFSIKTFGFSSNETPGPTAPLKWMRNAVEKLVPSYGKNYKLKRNKILLGLNLFGFDYTSDSARIITRDGYLNLLKHYNNRLKFDDVNIENFFMASDSEGRHTVFYPTLYSINERIKLAEELGIGLSLIELSCGLNYFFDLF